MTFKPIASAAQDQIQEALLLITGAKRGAKRATHYLSV
jgi:hypothetical protein